MCYNSRVSAGMPCYFIPAERSLPHEFSFYGQFHHHQHCRYYHRRGVIGIARQIRPLAIGGIVLAALGVIFFIAAFIRAWRSLKQGEKEKGGPER